MGHDAISKLLLMICAITLTYFTKLQSYQVSSSSLLTLSFVSVIYTLYDDMDHSLICDEFDQCQPITIHCPEYAQVLCLIDVK